MVTLPNGMRIRQWHRQETNFLYGEIFGDQSVYTRDDRIAFRPGSVIIDAGANIGMFSLFAASRCRGEATIYAFEPIPSTYAVLAANADAANRGQFDAAFSPAAGATLAIHAVNVGLSDSNRDVIFDHKPRFSIWSSSDPELSRQRGARILRDSPSQLPWLPAPVTRLISRPLLAWMNTSERVPATLVSLSSFIDEHRLTTIDILKIDVEGAEVDVLHGIEDRHWPLITQVVLEVEDFAAKDRVVELIEAHGFTTEWFASERDRNPGSLSEVSMVYAWR